MVKRVGVGATAVSAVIFSVLLGSSLSIYWAANENNRLHLAANAADAIADSGMISEGVAGTNVLLREQLLLETNVLGCGSASATLSREIEGMAGTQASANLSVVVTPVRASEGPGSDNLSMLAPFDGYVEGYVDTSLHMQMRGSAPSLGISYVKDETHYVHLPVRIVDLASVCDQALSDIDGAVSSTVLTKCTLSAVSLLVSGAAEAAGSKAAALGFRMAVHSAMARTAPCSIVVSVEVSQAGVVGPGGNFNVELRGEEVAAFET